MRLTMSYPDRYQIRGLPVASVFCIVIVGWMILFGVGPVNASAMALRTRYFGGITVGVSSFRKYCLRASWLTTLLQTAGC